MQTEANTKSESVIYRPNDQTVRPTPGAGQADTDHDREVREIDLLIDDPGASLCATESQCRRCASIPGKMALPTIGIWSISVEPSAAQP